MPLSAEFCRATDKFLKDNGLDPEDVSTVMQVLERYQAEAAAEDGTRSAVQWPSGGMDAKRFRQIAQDRALPEHLRRWPTPPMSSRQASRFAERFPGADKIKVV